MTDEYGNIKEELRGIISLKMHPGKTLDEFCEKHFNNYNRTLFEAVAIRFYYGREVIVTLYALDKTRKEDTNFDHNKMPVKKFKSSAIPFSDVLSYIDEFNFTLSNGNYPLDDMEVINK